MRKRRKIYVELNRHVDLYVYDKQAPGELLAEENFLSDFFVLSIPEPNSDFDVWLIKNLNKKDSEWQIIAEESLEAMQVENTMSEDEIMVCIDDYQRTQYDEDGEEFDEYGNSEYEREYFDVDETDRVDEELMDADSQYDE